MSKNQTEPLLAPDDNRFVKGFKRLGQLKSR